MCKILVARMKNLKTKIEKFQNKFPAFWGGKAGPGKVNNEN